jgi:hypothetical protein
MIIYFETVYVVGLIMLFSTYVTTPLFIPPYIMRKIHDYHKYGDLAGLPSKTYHLKGSRVLSAPI